MNTSAPTVRQLVYLPTLATLAVTLVRLSLELVGAPAWLASNAPGGAGALLGIAWLPLLFGPLFALRWRPHVAGTKALLKKLAKTLLVYGLLARIPVVLLTIPALLGNWGTHYEKFPFEAGTGAKIGATLLAQLGFWACIWTVVSGTIAGLAVASLRRAPEHAAA